MSLHGKKVLVTGAAGFIGSHLTERLVREGARVSAMVHYNASGRLGNLEYLPTEILDEVKVIKSELLDAYSVGAAVKGADVVFHLASLISIPYSYLAPASYASVNVMGTINVLHACMEHGVSRVIHTSTSEVYGTAMYTPIDEKHPLQAQSPYSATKIGADHVAQSFFLSFGLPVVIVRPFNTFGPRQSIRAVIPSIINQILKKQDPVKLGSVEPMRDFLYVSDTVSAFIAAADSDRALGEVINFGTGIGWTIKDTANLIMEVMNFRSKIVCDETRLRPQKSEVLRLLCDNSKARKLCGWSPEHSFRDALCRTVDFYRTNPIPFFGTSSYQY